MFHNVAEFVERGHADRALEYLVQAACLLVHNVGLLECVTGVQLLQLLTLLHFLPVELLNFLVHD